MKVRLDFRNTSQCQGPSSKCKGYGHYEYQCFSECQHVRTMSSNDVDDSKVIENIHVTPKTVSIIEDIAVDFDKLIINETYMSSDSVSNDVNVKFEPNTTIVPSKLVEFPHAEYSFMIIPTDSFFRKSPEFLVKIQQMISSTSSFLSCLEFVSESNVLPSAGLDVCPPRHVISLILPSLGVMPRILICIAFTYCTIDDMTRSIAICNDAYKFAANTYSIL